MNLISILNLFVKLLVKQVVNIQNLLNVWMNWKDKVLVFLKPPGWKPRELGGFQGATAKDRDTYRKFDTQVSGSISGYVVAQFILLLAVVTFFLFRQNDLGTARMWATAGLIVVWVMTMGLLLEGRRWALGVEVLRVILFALLLVRSTDLLPATVLLPVTAVLSLASLLALALLYRQLPRPVLH